MRFNPLANLVTVAQKIIGSRLIEDTVPYAYRDTNGILTIGIGFNLATGSHLSDYEAELEQILGYRPDPTSLAAIKLAARSDKKLAATGKVHPDSGMEKALADWATASKLISSPNQYNSLMETNSGIITDLFKDAYTEEQSIIKAHFPDLNLNSREALALIMAQYQGTLHYQQSKKHPVSAAKLAVAQDLVNNVTASGNRAEAWYDLRYGIDEAYNDKYAMRYYYTAEEFGLFSNSRSPNQDEIVQAIEMFVQNKGDILGYEGKFNPNYQANFGLPAVSDIYSELAPATAFINQNFARMLATSWGTGSTGNKNEINHILAIAENSADPSSRTVSATGSGSHIIIGSGNGQTLRGLNTNATDVLVGFGSGDTFVGSNKINYLIAGSEPSLGGSGSDTFKAGAYNNAIYAQGTDNNIILYTDNGDAINIVFDGDGNNKYQLSGNTETVLFVQAPAGWSVASFEQWIQERKFGPTFCTNENVLVVINPHSNDTFSSASGTYNFEFNGTMNFDTPFYMQVGSSPTLPSPKVTYKQFVDGGTQTFANWQAAVGGGANSFADLALSDSSSGGASGTGAPVFAENRGENFSNIAYGSDIEALGGGDVFDITRGLGAVNIGESDTSATADNIIAFGPDISLSSLSVTGDTEGDLILSLGNADSVTLYDALNSGAGINYGVQRVTFQDGTSASYAQLLQLADTGSATNTSLYGDGNANVIDSKGYATYAQGNGGGDTFVYNAGYGALEIDEADSSDNPQNVLAFGAGIDPASVGVTGDAKGDLIITVSTTDIITLDNALNNADGTAYGVQKVTFADGTVWTYADLLARAEAGSAITTGVYGDGSANTLDTHGESHVVQGGGGGDTFVYNSGYGTLTINEVDTATTPDNILRFGTGIDPSSVGVTADTSGDLLLNLGNGDVITLQNALNSVSGTTYGVQQVNFADGTSWSYADLLSMAETGSASNTRLYGQANAETFDSKGYATYEQGGGGGDTFIYDRGYGALTINEQDQSATPDNTLAFGAGILPSDVQVSADLQGDLILDLGSGDRITLTSVLNGYGQGVQNVTFADGTVWSEYDLLNLADIGSAASTSLYGDGNGTTFDSKGYATYEQGGGGGDTFIYNSGYGALTIDEIDQDYLGAQPDVLRFGAGIDPADVSISSDAQGDIILSLGGSDVITLKGMVASAHAGVQSVTFADGTVWGAAQILASLNGGTLTIDPDNATSAVGSTYFWDGSYGVRYIDASATGPQAVGTVDIEGDSTSYYVSVFENDIRITNGNGSGIQLVGALADAGAGMPSITFSDGATWTYSDLAAMLQTPNGSSAGGLYGDSNANTLDTQGMTGYAQGGGGGDTFVYNQGYGALEIYEMDASASPANVLTLGSGIDPSSVTVSADTNGDIILDLGDGNGDQIKLDSALNGGDGDAFGVQQIHFADGTTWTYADLLQKLETPTAGSAGIYGDDQANILDTQGLTNFAAGYGGGDTFVYNVGYGALEISESDWAATPDNVLAFGSGIVPSQVSVFTDGDGNLILSLGGSDQITLDNQLNSPDGSAWGVQEVTFADGTVWTAAQLAGFANGASTGGGSLIGTSGADVLDSGGTASYVQGNGGGDTFVYDRGYGAVEISEADTAASPDNILSFGTGIDPSQVNVSSDGEGNILLDLGGGDTITLDNALTSGGGTTWGVQQIDFADGTSWSYADLLSRLETATGAPALISGSTPGSMLDGGGTATYAFGKGGGDTFVYNEGYGQLTISEADQSASPSNVLAFGSDIAASDISVSADSNGDIILSLDEDDEVILQNALNNGGGTSYGVQTVTFADGTTWTYADLLSMVETASDASDGIYGDRTANTLDTHGLTGYAQGNGGGDTFVYNSGYGTLEINEADGAASPDNVLAFGVGIDPSNVTVSSDANGDIVLTLSATDQVIIDNALGSGSGTTWGVQHVTFQDGTSWSFSDVLAKLASATSPTAAIGTSGADTLDASGKSYLEGEGGGDTFTDASGDGYVTINETDTAATPANSLVFGAGISASDVQVNADTSGDLILAVSDTDVVVLQNALNSANGTTYGVQTVSFSDGTNWSYTDLLAKVETPSTSADGIYGDGQANTLDTQGLTDYAQGGGGGDTFVYDRGYGTLEINEADGAATPNNVLAFGVGIDPSDVTVTSDASGNLLLSLGGADQITIDNAFNSGDDITYGVQHVTFQDGTSWSLSDLIAKATIQASGGIFGDAGANVLDTRGLAGFAQGGGGGDTFVYNLHYGPLEIDEEDSAATPGNVLAFGAGISASSLSVSGDDNGDLVLSLGGSDQVTLDNALNSGGGTTYGVQDVTFQDGTSLSYAQLVEDAATGSATNTSIYGDGGANVLDSKGFADYAAGSGGGDTFVYNSGYGALEIDEEDSSLTPNNVLALGTGIDPSQVTVSGDADGDLILSLSGDDQITLDNTLNSGDGTTYGVQQVTFADGTVWTYSDLVAKAGAASSGGTGIYGDAGANLLDTQGLTHYAQGNGGGDTFVYNSGYGALEINELDGSLTPDNVLAFGTGIAPSQVTVTADADGNLILSLGGTDQITIDNALNSGDGTTYGVQQVTFADGTSWNYADLLAKADTGSTANTSLYGDSGANSFDSLGVARYEQGDGGGDTFVYDRGYGALTINEIDDTGANNVLAFGAGIGPSDVAASVDASGDILLDLGSGDVVTLQGAAPGGDAAGALSVSFANGQTWTAAQLAGLAIGNIDITPGSGTTVIDLAADPSGDVPPITIGAGLLASDFSVGVGGSNDADLILSADNGDQIILRNALTATSAADEVVQFSDGTSWTYAQMLADVETGTAGAAGVYGDASANTLDTQGLTSYAQGNGGGDTFVFNSGYDALEINEADSAANPLNTLAFGAGIDPSQVSVTGDSNGDLILSLGDGDQVTLDKALDSSAGTTYGVQQVTFADGTVWSYADLVAQVSNDSAFDGTAFGDSGANTLDTHGYQTNTFNDTIDQYVGYVQGGGGGDTINYGVGYGPVEINEIDTSVSPDNTLAFGTGIDASNVVVSTDAEGDILLNVNDGWNDEIILDNALNSTSGTAYGVQNVSFADGTTWTASYLKQMAETGSWRNPTLYGGAGADYFNPAGASFIQGNGGGDTVYYEEGYGRVTVDEYDTSADPQNVLQFAPDITADEVSVTWGGGNDLELSVADYYWNDNIILQNELLNAGSGPNGIEEVEFSDGTTWSYADLIAMASQGGPNNFTAVGDAGANLLDTHGYTDWNTGAGYAQGNGGGDTFVFNAGYGVLEINEVDTATTPDNVLQFGSGIDPSQITVSGDANGNLILDLGDGDRVILDKALQNGEGKTYGVQSVTFADGTNWTYQDLLSRAETPVSGAASISGDSGANILDTQGLVGEAIGNGGGDTFVYAPGYGDLVIDETDTTGNPHNRLSFGAGISASDVTVSADSSGDLLLTVAGSGTITISGGVASNPYGPTGGVQQVLFSDGTSWSYSDLMHLADTASATNTILYGDDRPEVFDSRGFATAEYGQSGSDEFLYNQGYGNLTINETGGTGTPDSVLSFGTGISLADLSVSEDTQGDMTLTVAGQGQIQVAGEFAGGSAGIQTVTFADGGSLSQSDLQRLGDTGSPTNTRLYGSSGADTFDSAGYATYIHGGGGADTFVYKLGYGDLEIDEDAGFFNITQAQIEFGTGITAADIQARLTASGNLVITDGVARDQITVDNFGQDQVGSSFYDRYGIGSISFADGSSLTQAQILQLALTPTADNGTIYGTAGNDVLAGGPDARFEDGLGGTDTYVYDAGDGALEIGNDNDNSSSNDILQFGSGITQADLTVRQDDLGDIVMTDGVSGDSITVDGMVGIRPTGYTMGLHEVAFADGTSLSAQQIVAMSMIGSPGDTQIEGTSQADYIDGKGYASYEYGGGGADTFAYDPGDGQVEIYEAGNNGLYGTSAVLQMGGSLTASDISASFDSIGDATITDSVTGDKIKLDREVDYQALYQGGYFEYGVTAIDFADGTSITQAQLLQDAVIGSPANTSLYGADIPETFDSKGYASYAQGISGQDTFVYDPGYGSLEINEDAGVWETSNSILAFGGSITPADLSVSGTANGAVVITDGTAGDAITLDKELLGDPDTGSEFGVSEVTFSDGESLTARQLVDLATTGAATNTSLYGSAGSDVIDSKGFATYAQGNGGSDTYVFDRGYGQLTVDNAGNSGASGEVSFGADVTEQNLWLQQSGQDLDVDILGTSDQIVLKNWYASDADKVQTFVAGDGMQLDYGSVDQLVQAMASFASANPTFSITSATTMPNDTGLQSAITASWHN